MSNAHDEELMIDTGDIQAVSVPHAKAARPHVFDMRADDEATVVMLDATVLAKKLAKKLAEAPSSPATPAPEPRASRPSYADRPRVFARAQSDEHTGLRPSLFSSDEVTTLRPGSSDAIRVASRPSFPSMRPATDSSIEPAPTLIATPSSSSPLLRVALLMMASAAVAAAMAATIMILGMRPSSRAAAPLSASERMAEQPRATAAVLPLIVSPDKPLRSIEAKLEAKPEAKPEAVKIVEAKPEPVVAVAKPAPPPPSSPRAVAVVAVAKPAPPKPIKAEAKAAASELENAAAADALARAQLEASLR